MVQPCLLHVPPSLTGSYMTLWLRYYLQMLFFDFIESEMGPCRKTLSGGIPEIVAWVEAAPDR